MNGHMFRPPRSFASAAVVLLIGLLIGCSQRPVPSLLPHERQHEEEVMVMSYNLYLYAHMDRDQDGQPDDFKPDTEIDALIDSIKHSRPDILAVQEIGRPDALEHFRERLNENGLIYPHVDYLRNHGSFANLAVLSRFPISQSSPVTNLAYTIKGERFPVQRGFQKVYLELPNGSKLTVINVHLKSKRYHPSGQTEMRRNESRLLATHVRQMLEDRPDELLLVCGDFNDQVDSSAMRELLHEDSALVALELADSFGQIWTHFYRKSEVYSRIDYLLTSPALHARWIKKKSGILLSPEIQAASDHRPVYATFNFSY